MGSTGEPGSIGGFGPNAGPGPAGIGTPTTPGAGAVPGTVAGGPGQSFLDSLGSAFGQLNSQLTSADSTMADFASGGSSDLQTVMLQMQEASIGLKLGLQVRDRLLEAYQDVMRLQL